MAVRVFGDLNLDQDYTLNVVKKYIPGEKANTRRNRLHFPGTTAGNAIFGVPYRNDDAGFLHVTQARRSKILGEFKFGRTSGTL